MAFYAADRFGLNPLVVKQDQDTIVRTAASDIASRYTAKESSASVISTVLAPLAVSVASTPPPAKTEQQQADQELAELEKQQEAAELEAAVQETLDLGPPPGTPWLLYAGVGVGALVLVGGALFATRKKGKKLSGYRKRRRRR